MYTVISIFDDRAQAQHSVDRLVELGIRRGDIHIEPRGLHTGSAAPAFGDFFTSLLGQDRPSEDANRFSGAVDRGRHVLVADALDDLQAERVSALLAGMGGQGGDTVHRPLSRPLRDIVAVREVLADQAARRGGDRDLEPDRRADRQQVRQQQKERALAFGGAFSSPELRDPEDPRHAIGFRNADKSSNDKPRR